MLVLVAAGLVASAIHTAHEAGWLDAGQAQAFDLSWLVVPGTWTSALLTGMLGWQPQPTEAEVIGYLLYLVPATLYVLWPAQLGTRVARTASTTTLLLLLVLALAACGSSGGDKGGNSKQVEVKLTDAGCSPATLKLDAGRTTFKVTNAGTGRVSELEVLKGSRILGEKENLVAGLSGSFTIDAAAGPVHAQLPGRDDRRDRRGHRRRQAGGRRTDPRLQAAVTGYRGYVHGQAELLVSAVRPFVAAVKAGDVAEAKRQFAAARAPYETIEPVAESFGTLDPEIDARVNDVKKGEKLDRLPPHRAGAVAEATRPRAWARSPTSCCATASRSSARRATLDYQPDELANGANGLLGEVASSKITGEEDRYSHTDLTDFQANISGSQTTFGLLAPTLRERTRTLTATIGKRFDAVQQELRGCARAAASRPTTRSTAPSARS